MKKLNNLSVFFWSDQTESGAFVKPIADETELDEHQNNMAKYSIARSVGIGGVLC